MAASTWQQIIGAVKTQLATIRKVNGYETDAGFKVFEWKATASPYDDLPVIHLKDTSLHVAQGTIQQYTWALQIDIEIAASKSAQTSAEIRSMAQDVISALWKDKTISGLALNISQPQIEDFTIQKDEKVIGGAVIRCVVTFITAAGSV